MFQPLGGRAMLRRITKESDTNSPFITPEVAKTKATECEVVGVSAAYYSDSGVWMHPPVGVGDTVLIGKYSGNEHKVGGEDMLFVRWDELLAVVTHESLAAPSSLDPAVGNEINI